MAASESGRPSSPLAEQLFIQFARSPLPGQVKTRMQPHLSAQQACDLHEALLQWTCTQLVSAGLGPVEIWTSGAAGHRAFDHCIEMGARGLRLQQGSDLGERMHRALGDGLQRARKVILVGSDCPAIDGAYLQEALLALDEFQCVLGPARDGGYVLIGARERVPDCFVGVDWGTERVYQQTVACLQSQGVTWHALHSLPDIDRPEDLPEWEKLQRASAELTR